MVFELLTRYSTTAAASLAEYAVVSVLKRIKHGYLIFETPSRLHTFGNPAAAALGEPVAEIQVLNDVFWLRLAAANRLGFGEAFMFGDFIVKQGHLTSIFKIFILNEDALQSLSSFPLSEYLIWYPQAIFSASARLNSLGGSKSNVVATYDISNEMYEAFLSPDMSYSCAFFEKLNEDLEHHNVADDHHSDSGSTLTNGSNEANMGIGKAFPASPSPGYSSLESDPLFVAQMRKYESILRKADIKPGHRVLEIGTGWGAFAILAAQRTGCTVDAITLSEEQAALACSRINAAGLSSSITVHILDYRNLPVEWEGQFDRFVSIEMMEHVGREFYEGYWSVVDRMLKKKDAIGVVQVITNPEARFNRYSRDLDFVEKYIFPGGSLPSVAVLVSTLEKGSAGKLTIDSIMNIGPHYARTLREWRSRFEANFDDLIVPAMKKSYPDTMSAEELDVFRRKFVYYFSICEVGLAERCIGTHILTFTREANRAFGCQA